MIEIPANLAAVIEAVPFLIDKNALVSGSSLFNPDPGSKTKENR